MLRLLPIAMLAAFGLSLHAQFTMQNSGTAADLRGIVNVGNGTAWASGTHGTVLRTEDGGYMWQGCAMPPDAEQLDFRGIQAFDDQTAIVMSSGKGALSRVYKTTDGCNTWKLVFTNPDTDGFFDALRMTTQTQLFVLGDPVHGQFALFVSKDGGATWTPTPPPGLAADPARQGAFAASNSALVASGLAHTYFATGGTAGSFLYERKVQIAVAVPGSTKPSQSEQASWSRAPIPVGGAHHASAGVFSLAEDQRSGNIVAVGGDYMKPEAVEDTSATRLAGTDRWKPSRTSPGGYRSSVAYDVSAKVWITVGPNGTDVSTDDGQNWHALKPGYGDDPNADKHWNALSLPYVVGPHGRIGRLRDDVLTGITK